MRLLIRGSKVQVLEGAQETGSQRIGLFLCPVLYPSK